MSPYLAVDLFPRTRQKYDINSEQSSHDDEVMAKLSAIPVLEPNKNDAESMHDFEQKAKGGIYGDEVKNALVPLWSDLSGYVSAYDPRRALYYINKALEDSGTAMPEKMKSDLDKLIGGKAVSIDFQDVVSYAKKGKFGDNAKIFFNNSSVADKVKQILANGSFTKSQKIAFFNQLSEKLDPALKDFVAEIENGGHPFYDAENNKLLAPYEGEVKTVNGVQYVLQNGRWHKVGGDEEGKSKTANKDEFDVKPGKSVEDACFDAVTKHFDDVSKSSKFSQKYKDYLESALKTVNAYSWTSPLWKARMLAQAGKEYYDKENASGHEMESIFKTWKIFDEAMEKKDYKNVFQPSANDDEKTQKLKEILKEAQGSSKDMFGQMFVYDKFGDIKQVLESSKTPHQKLMAIKKLYKEENMTAPELEEKLNALSKKKTVKAEVTEDGKKALIDGVINKAKSGGYGEHVKDVMNSPFNQSALAGIENDDSTTQATVLKNLVIQKDAKEFVKDLKDVVSFKPDLSAKTHINPKTLDEFIKNIKLGFYGKGAYGNLSYILNGKTFNEHTKKDKIQILELQGHHVSGKGASDYEYAVKNLGSLYKHHVNEFIKENGFPPSVEEELKKPKYQNISDAIKENPELLDGLKDLFTKDYATFMEKVNGLKKVIAVSYIEAKDFVNFATDAMYDAYENPDKAYANANQKSEEGQHEGDTKEGVGGTLMLVNGHWVLVNKEKAFDKLTSDISYDVYGKNMSDALVELGDKYGLDVMGDPAKYAEGIFDAISKNKQHFISQVGEKHCNSLIEHLAEYSPKIQEKIKNGGYSPSYELEDDKEYSNATHQNDNVPEVTISSLLESDSTDASSWKQVGGQAGSNEGGMFKDENGQKWYCKFPKDEDHARSEVLAGELYKACGIPVAETKIITKDGKIGIASKFVSGLEKDKNGVGSLAGAKEGFAVDAWLGNWDAVGLGFDNLLNDGNGSAVRIDVGGSLEYRAQGQKKGKAFGNEVTELETMLDSSKNAQTAHVFKGMSKEELNASVKNVLKLSDSSISNLVHSFAGGTEKSKLDLINKLIARKNHLAQMFPEVADEFKPKQVIALPEPPDFNNFPGVGKVSQKAWKNAQNTEVCKKIYDAVGKDGIEGLNNVKFDLLDENSGDVIKKDVSLAEHKSGKVQKYAKDVEFAYHHPKTINPEGVVNVVGKAKGTIFEKVNQLFKKVGYIKEAVKQIGRYAVLGRVVGGHISKHFKFPKLNKDEQEAFKKKMYLESIEKYKKLKASERKAIRDYTGSDYSQMNSNVLADNAGETEKALMNGMEKACVELPEGFKLSRRVDMKPEDLAKLVGSNGDDVIGSSSIGSILQDMNGAISTSMRPTFWSGNVQFKITCAKGTKGLYVADNPAGTEYQGVISMHPGEDEVLLPHSTRFYVQKVYRKDQDFLANHSKDEYGHWGTKNEDYVVEVIALPA